MRLTGLDWAVVRVALTGCLLAILAGQLVWFGGHPPVGAGADLSARALHENYETYVGQRVVVTAPVVEVDPVVLALHGDDATSRLTVSGVSKRVSVGDRLQVFGIVRPGNEMRALNTITVPRWGLAYTYTVSFLAGFWVLLRIGRHWRLNPWALALERRDHPIEFRDVLPWGNDDA